MQKFDEYFKSKGYNQAFYPMLRECWMEAKLSESASEKPYYQKCDEQRYKDMIARCKGRN